MRFTKQIDLVQLLVVFLSIAPFTQTAQAKSAYAIVNHQGDIIGAFKIQGNQIEYQAEIQAPQHATRAIDLAIDSDSCCIFVTYEGSNIIEIMNAKSLENEHPVTATGASDLAGIVFDEAKQKLYVVDRGTDKLFAYLWTAASKTLIPDGTNPKVLSDIYEQYGYGAYGIALGTVNGRLYVTNYTSTIHYYDTDDWTHVGSVDVGEIAVDVDIDSDRRYLYAGGYSAHNYLVKFDLNTGIAESTDIGAGVIGLAVDPDSGLVYTTTYHDQLRVYDTSASPFTLTDSENISAGCGVCVPNGDISYKPDVFTLSKSDDVADCVSPEDEFKYTINYGANGSADTGVVIIDYLPIEADYVSSDPLGAYNGVTHTVTWVIGDISGSDSGILEITVEVNYLARPGDTVVNAVEMEGELYYSRRTTSTGVCCWYPGDRIYVDKDAT